MTEQGRTDQGGKLSYSINEVVRLTGLSERMVRRLIAEGELPVVRVGRRVFVMAADLQAFLERRRSR